jgi:hypothetical protein
MAPFFLPGQHGGERTLARAGGAVAVCVPLFPGRFSRPRAWRRGLGWTGAAWLVLMPMLMLMLMLMVASLEIHAMG